MARRRRALARMVVVNITFSLSRNGGAFEIHADEERAREMDMGIANEMCPESRSGWETGIAGSGSGIHFLTLYHVSGILVLAMNWWEGLVGQEHTVWGLVGGLVVKRGFGVRCATDWATGKAYLGFNSQSIGSG